METNDVTGTVASGTQISEMGLAKEEIDGSKKKKKKRNPFKAYND